MKKDNVIKIMESYDSKREKLESRFSAVESVITWVFTIPQIPLFLFPIIYVIALIGTTAESGIEFFVEALDPLPLFMLGGFILLQLLKNSLRSYFALRFELKENTLDRNYTDAVEDFESTAQAVGTRFEGNQYVNEIIAELTKDCLKRIVSADRGNSVENLDISYYFDVYQDRITGTGPVSFYFSKERLKNLDEIIEQAALARVIGAGIAANIEARFPKDISGTERTVELSYSQNFKLSRVIGVIRYTAQNGNYRPLKNW